MTSKKKRIKVTDGTELKVKNKKQQPKKVAEVINEEIVGAFEVNEPIKDEPSGTDFLALQLLAANLDKKKNKSHANSRKSYLWVLLIAIGLVVALIINAVVNLPIVTIGKNKYAAAQTADQIAAETFEQLKQQKIKFERKNIAAEFSMTEAGILLDVQDLTDQVTKRRQVSLQNLFFKTKIEPKFSVDHAMLQSLLNQTFKEELIEPVNATARYNAETKQFELVEAQDGYQVDAKTVLPNAEQVELGRRLEIKVEYRDVKPQISSNSAKKTVDYLNQRLALRLNLNHEGKMLYFADPWDVADWAVITAAESGDVWSVDFDKTKIQTFIEKTVTPQIQRAVVNKKILVNDKGDELQVLQEGRRGFGAVNPGNAAEEMRQALIQNRNLDFELNIKEIDFEVERVNFNGQKWVLVDLSDQTTTLYSGNTALQTFVISSGVSPWYTPTGTFYVWYKIPKQVMTGGSHAGGDYYYLPNVTWNTYFTRSGIGFHTAYWHNNFGRPMSHGCINMREADARVVYEFAPIGTMVVVQN